MHNVKSSVGIPILVTALACSLAFNLVQYAAKKAPLPPLSGTYRTAETSPGAGAYLVFDRNGNYCRYTQAQGVFEIGTYAEGGENQISLTASTGAYRCVLRTRDATYLFADADLISFTKQSDIPSFSGRAGEHPPEWGPAGTGQSLPAAAKTHSEYNATHERYESTETAKSGGSEAHGCRQKEQRASFM